MCPSYALFVGKIRPKALLYAVAFWQARALYPGGTGCPGRGFPSPAVWVQLRAGLASRLTFGRGGGVILIAGRFLSLLGQQERSGFAFSCLSFTPRAARILTVCQGAPPPQVSGRCIHPKQASSRTQDRPGNRPNGAQVLIPSDLSPTFSLTPQNDDRV